MVKHHVDHLEIMMSFTMINHPLKSHLEKVDYPKGNWQQSAIIDHHAV